jgi:hypothetical protein
VEVLREVEREQPLAVAQVGQKGQLVRRVHEGHQVGQERHLQERALDHEAGMPAEGALLLEERGVQAVERVGERGQ